MSTGTSESPGNFDRLSSDQLLDLVVSNAPIVLFATDEDGRIVMSRGKALAALGLREGELVGQSVFDLYVSEPSIASAACRALQGESVTVQLDLNGTIHETLFAPLRRGNRVRGIVGVATDITDRARTEAELRRRATLNPATGLPNRSHFVSLLSAALDEARAAAQPVALVVITVDRFTEVSETFGYSVGTQILRTAAERLSEAADPSATVALMEAGKFGLFAPIALRRAPEVAERVVRAVGEPFELEGMELSLSVHAGIAVFPGHGQDAESLIRAAERTARLAPRSRTSVAIYEPQTSDLTRNFKLLADLQAAPDRGQLRVEYQPLIDLRTKELDSVEALLRWEHPTLGPVRPDEFIPIAEHGGLLPDLTSFVVEEVARQLYVWDSSGLRLRAAVNVSPAEILAPRIEDTVRPALGTWGIPLERLTLEVTEHSSLGETSPREQRRLENLTEDGLQLAIDDFGTGYSNLGTLHRLPWSQLKVDRSFVGGIEDDQRRQLVGAMIDLGHSLGRTVVAEGVETREQWETLAELGCDYAQGYLVSPPVPPQALPALVESAAWPGRASS